MGKRENDVETYFDQMVATCLEGVTRKWVCPTVDGVPDRIPIWPNSPGQVFVEVKTIDGTSESWQEREHVRLREAGALVFVVWGHSGVSSFMNLAMLGMLQSIHDQGKYDLK